MNKTRLEAFSDGVFAIVITLLILDIRLPHTEYEELGHALRDLLPKILSYVMSFAVIGLYWIGHHYYFRSIEKINNLFAWFNIGLLLLVTFLPFPTSLLGEYPFRTIPVLLYGSNLLAVNLASFGMLYYVRRHPEMASANFTDAIYNNFVKLFLIVNVPYALAIALSFVAPAVSYVLFIIVLIIAMVAYAKRNG